MKETKNWSIDGIGPNDGYHSFYIQNQYNHHNTSISYLEGIFYVLDCCTFQLFNVFCLSAFGHVLLNLPLT